MNGPKLTLLMIMIVALLVPAGAAIAEGEGEYQKVQDQSSILNGIVDGTVTGIQGTIVQVLGGKFMLDVSKAKITSGVTRQNLSLSSIGVGMHIIAAINHLPANSLSPLEPDSVSVRLDNEGIISGPVQEIDPANRTLTVLNQRILVNDKTVIRKANGMIGRLEHLKVGRGILTLLQVEGADLAAIEIVESVEFREEQWPGLADLAPMGAVESNMKIMNTTLGSVNAVVTGIQGTIAQVLGGKFALDVSKAKIAPTLSCQNLSASSIGLGMPIWATIDNVPTENSLPLEAGFVFIELSNEGEINGPVQEIDPANRTLTVLNQRILVNDQTLIRKINREQVGLNDLKTGRPVNAVLRLEGADLLATVIFQMRKHQSTLIGLVSCN